MKNSRRRILSDFEIGSKMTYFNDTSTEEKEYPPEEFYHFLKVNRNTREKLINTNKDLFLIFGQNGVICSVFVASYLII